MAWTLKAVGLDGTVHATLDQANLTELQWPATNAPGDFTFELPLDDPKFTEIDFATSPQREVQVFHNTDTNPIMWGKPITRKVDSVKRVWTIRCKDPLWYATRRCIDVPLPNFLLNPSFEAGTGSWAPHTEGSANLTYTVDNVRAVDGGNSAKLVSTNAGGPEYIHQEVVLSGGLYGLNAFVSAWFYIENWIGPAPFNVGFIEQVRDATYQGDYFKSFDSTIIDKDTPVGTWLKQETRVYILPHATSTVTVKLWGIHGTIRWDSLRMTTERGDRWGWPNPPADISVIAKDVLEGIQGRGSLPLTGKSDFKLAVDASVPIGSTRDNFVYWYFDHKKAYDGGNGNGALDEFTRASDGFEMRVNYTPTTRTVVIRRTVGVDRTALTLQYHNYPDGSGTNTQTGIIGWDYSDSIENSATQVTEVAAWESVITHNDPSRDERQSTDASFMSGLTLELVEDAPASTLVNALQVLADGRLGQLKRPVTTPVLILAEPTDPVTGAIITPLIGVILPADLITPDLIDGQIQMSGTWRVAAVQIDPKTERMTVTVNPT